MTIREQNPIRSVRYAHGLTLSQLANRAGIARDTLARVEGGAPCDAQTAAQLARALLVPSWVLVHPAAAREYLRAATPRPPRPPLVEASASRRRTPVPGSTLSHLWAAADDGVPQQPRPGQPALCGYRPATPARLVPSTRWTKPTRDLCLVCVEIAREIVQAEDTTGR